MPTETAYAQACSHNMSAWHAGMRQAGPNLWVPGGNAYHANVHAQVQHRTSPYARQHGAAHLAQAQVRATQALCCS
jgi:hypothetical protein